MLSRWGLRTGYEGLKQFKFKKHLKTLEEISIRSTLKNTNKSKYTESGYNFLAQRCIIFVR